MSSRRQLLCLLPACLLPAFLLPAGARATPAGAEQAAAFIRRTGADLTAIVEASGSAALRRARLAGLIDRVVAVDFLARFCLGRFWHLASPQQQATYVRLFHAVLLDNIVSHIGTGRRLQNPSFNVAIGRTHADGAEIEVLTTVERTGSPELIVVWLVRQTSHGPRIVDLRALGVSVRVTVHDDIAAYLARHDDSIPQLLLAMRRMVSAAQAPAAP